MSFGSSIIVGTDEPPAPPVVGVAPPLPMPMPDAPPCIAAGVLPALPAAVMPAAPPDTPPVAGVTGGITLAAKPSAGTYILSIGSAVTGKPILASPAYAADASDQRGATSAGPCGGGAEGRTCPSSDNTSSIMIQARGSDGNPADHAFYVAIFG